MDKQAIIREIQELTSELSAKYRLIDTGKFFHDHTPVWNPAQQIDHLAKSCRPLRLGMALPKITFLIFGKHKGTPDTFENIRSRYRQSLSEGAKAPRGYKASGNLTNGSELNKTRLIDRWEAEMHKLILQLDKWSESDLDSYRIPHPILGNISARGMLFFTLYHTRHHDESIASLV